MAPAPEKDLPTTTRAAVENKFRRFGYVAMPEDAVQPILDVATRRAVFEWLAEIQAESELLRYKVPMRKRMLLDGPPGTGKTTLAHHVAARIRIPMVTVLASSLNSSYVGESAANVAKLFAAARQMPEGVVLFLDELDAIARSRSGNGGRGSHTEAEGATISLLAELDRHKGVVFAATNQPEKIDPAVHRRFNMKIEIGLPGPDERGPLIRLYMQPLAIDDDVVEVLVEALDGASPALIKDMCEAIKRGLVLGPRLQFDTALSALVRRAVTFIRPHEDMVVPKLWSDTAAIMKQLDLAAGSEWPPSL